MNEIRFRLIKDNEIVGYEFHYQGEFYAGATFEHNGDSPYGIYQSGNGKHYTQVGLNYTCIEHDSKNQYTTRKDKRGVDVFHKDIIQWDEKNGGGIGVVEWCDQDLAWIVKGSGSWLCGVEDVGTKIGNAYENHELMESIK